MTLSVNNTTLVMPPEFADGLDVWSSGDGTPGSDTYANALNAAFVAADQDFAGCLEIQKVNSTERLRYMGQTPIIAGCYLRITARIKAVAGSLPTVAIAGFAADASGAEVSGIDVVGDPVSIDSYGRVFEISAIVGAGVKDGVDLVWPNVAYGHFGLNITGPNGGVVRIDDLKIEDVSDLFVRGLLNTVDVRDFGAVGDNSTDNTAAFEAADATAQGRKVLVPEGQYYLRDSVTFENHVEFQGTVRMPADKIFNLQKDFHIAAYIDAFGDEELALKKAIQSLFNNSDHETLDLCGRRLTITEPIDVQAAVANKDSYAQRREIQNGQLDTATNGQWDTEVFTSQAAYDDKDPFTLRNVTSIASIPVGSLVTANGVGREVYVRAVDLANQEITLSAPLFDAVGTQNYTFTRFKYLLDFSGFHKLSKFNITDVDFLCKGVSSAIMLAPAGLIFHVSDCYFTSPNDRAITSIGEGCQGMMVDRCQFLTKESGVPAQDRVSIALNANANDVKIRDNRITQFRHFAVLGGTSSIITSNHWFHGDDEPEGLRMAGLVLTRSNNRATISGNYIDNCFVEWANEHDNHPDFVNEFSFSGLNISNNIFQSIGAAPWTRFIVVKPHGTGHFVSGLTIVGNAFRSIHGTLDRVDYVDTSYADLDYSRMKNITMTGNSFNNIETPVSNPAYIVHGQNSDDQTWNVNCAGNLLFDGRARFVESVVTTEAIKSGSIKVWSMPYALSEQGANKDQIHLKWDRPVRGSANLMVRIDIPQK